MLEASTIAPTNYTTIVAAGGVGTNVGGDTDIPGAGLSVTAEVSGLTSGTYKAYFVIRDVAGNETFATADFISIGMKIITIP